MSPPQRNKPQRSERAVLVQVFFAWLLALGLFACGSGESEAEAKSWPAGTAVALGNQAILADEIDRDIDALLDIEKAYVVEQRRRLILTNIAMPRAYARGLDPARMEAARREAQSWRESFDSSGPPAPLDSRLTGNWDEIGLGVWLVARDLLVGETSAVVELPGEFLVVRLIERDNAENLAIERLTVEIQRFPFVDDVTRLADDLETTDLVIVDPAWDEIVPGYYKYKMKADL